MRLTFNDRIELLIKALGYNPNSFSVALGYKGNNKIQRLIKTDNKPSYELLKDINDMFVNVDMDWLITGKGNMFKSENVVSSDELLDCMEKKNQLTDLLIEKEAEIKKLNMPNI